MIRENPANRGCITKNTAHSAELGPLYCRLSAARSHTSPSSEARSPMADWW